MKQEIRLDIVPTAQARARHSYVKALGRVVAHKSGSQRDNERTLESMLLPHKPATPLAGPVGIAVRCYFPIPASVSRKKREGMAGAYHTKKPDTDNLLKQVLDCLTRLRFWEDDKQVVHMVASKKYSEIPRWEIEIQDLEVQP